MEAGSCSTEQCVKFVIDDFRTVWHQQKWLNLAKPGAWEKCAILVRLARPCKAWAESLHLYQIWPECATLMPGLDRKWPTHMYKTLVARSGQI